MKTPSKGQAAPGGAAVIVFSSIVISGIVPAALVAIVLNIVLPKEKKS